MNGRATTPSTPLRVGDQVRHIYTGKVGPILSLGLRAEWDGTGEKRPRAIVLVGCAINRTDHIQVRVAYDPDDLIPSALDLTPTEAAIVRLKALPNRRRP